FDFPIGFFTFGVEAFSGDLVSVRIDPPPGVHLTSYWKFGPELDNLSTPQDETNLQPHWWEFTWDPATGTGAQRNGNAIVLYFRDGRRGDRDSTLDGIVWDPGGAAFRLPPIAAEDVYTIGAGGTLDVPAAGVLANDSDPAGGRLSAVLVQGPSHGSLVLDPAGSFRYRPEPGFAGTDTFVYRASASGEGGESAAALVTITV